MGPQAELAACAGASGLCSTPPLSSLLPVLTCPARPGQPLALSSTAGVRGPGRLRSHAAGPEKARIWCRLRRLRTEHFGPPRPGTDSVSTHWVGTLLQPRGSDLVSPLRWPLDTCVLCLPIPLPAPGWGRHRDSLRWEAVLPARALRPWAGPCPRSAFLGGQICTGAFLHCLPVTREGPGSSDKRTLAAPSRCERCLPRVMLAFAPRSSQVPAAHSAKLRALTTVLTATGGGADGKACACNVGDPGSIPGSGRSPGEGNGNPLQYSCLENSMD